jgi:hypothetical protein
VLPSGSVDCRDQVLREEVVGEMKFVLSGRVWVGSEVIRAGRNELRLELEGGERWEAVFIGGVDTAVKRLRKRFAADTTCVTGVPIPPPGPGGADAIVDRRRVNRETAVRCPVWAHNLLKIYKIQ